MTTGLPCLPEGFDEGRLQLPPQRLAIELLSCWAQSPLNVSTAALSYIGLSSVTCHPFTSLIALSARRMLYDTHTWPIAKFLPDLYEKLHPRTTALLSIPLAPLPPLPGAWVPGPLCVAGPGACVPPSTWPCRPCAFYQIIYQITLRQCFSFPSVQHPGQQSGRPGCLQAC